MELNINLLLAVSVSLLASWYLLPKVRQICYKKKLFDSHDERTVHSGVVPRLGGLVFFPVLLGTFLIIVSFNLIIDPSLFTRDSVGLFTEWMLAMTALLIIYLTGVEDDLVNVRYRTKLLMQILAAFVFILSGTWINNLHGLFGIHELHPAAGIPLTIFVIVFIVNSINFIDGIDGLAAGIGMLSFLFYGLIFQYLEMNIHSILAFICFGMLIPFFYFNVFGKSAKQSKIFMGDSGSLTIGLLLAFFAIKLTNASPGGSGPNSYSMILAFSVLIVPMFDAIKVILNRLCSGKSPFKADKGHIHHMFLQLGFSHRRSMFCILMLAVFFTVGSISIAPYISSHLLLGLVVFLWVGLDFLLKKLQVKHVVPVESPASPKKWGDYPAAASGSSSSRRNSAPRED